MNSTTPIDHEDAEPKTGSERIVNIENFHYSRSDLEELRRIAEIDPELARKVVDQHDRSNQRDHVSERIGIAVAAFLVTMALGTVMILILMGGFLQLVIGVAVIVVIAAMLRVILTGEWSDTSWTGKFVSKVAALFGGLPSNDTEAD